MSGAGVLYQTRIDQSHLPDGYAASGGRGPHSKPKDHLTFDSSGLLYRSNLLVYDRQTDTFWYQLWATPAFGPLVGSGLQPKRLPVTLTTWKAWYADHPDTKVMAFDTGFVRDYSMGSANGEYIDSPDTMFPVWRRSDLLPTKSWVFAQLIDGRPKAYPLSLIKTERVINDTLGGQNLVVIYDRGGHGARAYQRGEHMFAPAAKDTTTTVLENAGHKWLVGENTLVGPSGKKLARLPGHMAYWFGWFSFYPETEVYGR